MIKKLLLKLLGNNIYTPEKIELEKMQTWLYKSYKDQGFTSYFTMRKKYLINLLALGLEGKEQQRVLGRLEELRGLATNIKTEVNNRKKELEKKKP
jgi:hypothetical protein